MILTSEALTTEALITDMPEKEKAPVPAEY
jgi:hypothetical protein